MVNHRSQFDTDIEIVTPENIAFRYRVAGPFRRLPAYLIDLMIRLGVAVVGLIAFSLVFGILGIGIGVGPGMAGLLTLSLWFLLAWFYGGVLETYFTKNEILEMYLNMVYFGNGAYGLKTASDKYFGHDYTQLTLNESAMLVPFLVAPTKYNVLQNPIVAEKRQKQLLKRIAAL